MSNNIRRVSSCASQEIVISHFRTSFIAAINLKRKLFFFLLITISILLSIEPILGKAVPSHKKDLFQKSIDLLKIQVSTQSLELMQVVNIQRQEFLQKQCKLLGYNNNITNKLTKVQMNNMLIDRKHRILYCAIPKAANTNWERFLWILNRKSKKSINSKQSTNFIFHDPRLYLKFHDLHKTEQAKVMTPEYVRFIFVRHPFERLLSVYLDELKSKKWFHSKTVQKSLGVDIVKALRSNPSKLSLTHGDDIRFDEFIQYLLIPGINLKEHYFYALWRPMHQLCNPCLMNYNMIGKYETLAIDSALTIYLAGLYNTSFPIGQKSFNIRYLMREYFDKLKISSIRNIYEIYADDFRLFDYTLEEILGFEFI